MFTAWRKKSPQRRKQELIVIKVGIACRDGPIWWKKAKGMLEQRTQNKKLSSASPTSQFSINPAECVCSVLPRSVLGKQNCPATKALFNITRNGPKRQNETCSLWARFPKGCSLGVSGRCSLMGTGKERSNLPEVKSAFLNNVTWN